MYEVLDTLQISNFHVLLIKPSEIHTLKLHAYYIMMDWIMVSLFLWTWSINHTFGQCLSYQWFGLYSIYSVHSVNHELTTDLVHL